MLKHYGVENGFQSLEIRLKAYETAKRNGSYKKSKQADKIFKMLKEVFPLTERQYSSELYPFHCDFYIPEINTYIEYQGYWTHGKHGNNIYKSYYFC